VVAVVIGVIILVLGNNLINKKGGGGGTIGTVLGKSNLFKIGLYFGLSKS
jgi:hypothetical protein